MQLQLSVIVTREREQHKVRPRNVERTDRMKRMPINPHRQTTVEYTPKHKHAKKTHPQKDHPQRNGWKWENR